MSTSFDHRNGRVVARIHGALDGMNADAFLEEAAAYLEHAREGFQLDATELTHISSLGLGVLTRLHQRLTRAGGPGITIVGLNPDPREVFRITRLDQVFTIKD